MKPFSVSVIGSLGWVVLHPIYTANKSGVWGLQKAVVQLMRFPPRTCWIPGCKWDPNFTPIQLSNIRRGRGEISGPLTVDCLDLVGSQRFNPYNPRSNRTSKNTQAHPRNGKNGYPKWCKRYLLSILAVLGICVKFRVPANYLGSSSHKNQQSSTFRRCQNIDTTPPEHTLVV